MIEVIRHDSPSEFLQVTGEFFGAREALNNQFYGIVGDAIRGRYRGGNNLWLTAQHDGEVIGAALQTPPWEISVAQGTPPDACTALMKAALSFGFDATVGARLPPDLAQVVSAALGRRLVLTEGQGIYRLETVVHPEGVPGHMRPSAVGDLAVMTDYSIGFSRETGAFRGSEDALAARVREVHADGSFAVWEVDGEVVSMAASRGPTPNGIRISWVYTPPARRGCGYASAVVAALSQHELDTGRAFCFLFTNLANPTSNKIYQNIGYVRVGQLNRYGTADPGAPGRR